MTTLERLTTSEAAARIKAGLKARGIGWVSVRKDNGTACGWIKITVAPSQRAEYCKRFDELCDALAFAADDYHRETHDRCAEYVHHNSISVYDTNDAYHEYIARAEGRTPEVYGQRYWD